MNTKSLIFDILTIFCQNYQIAYDKFIKILHPKYYLARNYSKKGIVKSTIKLKPTKSTKKITNFNQSKYTLRNYKRSNILAHYTQYKIQLKYNAFYSPEFPS